MSNETTELGHLIDCPEKEFRDYCDGKDLGFICSFHNLMIHTFNEVCDIKDELVLRMSKKSESDRTEEEKTTLQGLYSKLAKMEHRIFILKEIIKERSLVEI